MLPSSPLSVAVPAGPLPARRSRGTSGGRASARGAWKRSSAAGRAQGSSCSSGGAIYPGSVGIVPPQTPAPSLLPGQPWKVSFPRVSSQGAVAAAWGPCLGCRIPQTLVSPPPAGPWGLRGTAWGGLGARRVGSLPVCPSGWLAASLSVCLRGEGATPARVSPPRAGTHSRGCSSQSSWGARAPLGAAWGSLLGL